MNLLMKDVLVALGVGVAFLLIALAFQLSVPTLVILPVATFAIFLATRILRRRKTTDART
jgi:membrane protein implicated in regulation of membrane protease activity